MDGISFKHYLKRLTFSLENHIWVFQNMTHIRDVDASSQPLSSIEDIRGKVAQHKRATRDLKRNSPQRSAVSLLIGAGNGKQHAFTMTDELFREFLGSGRLAQAFVQSTCCNNGSLGYFVDYSSDCHNAKPSSLVVIISPYTPYDGVSLAFRMSIQTGALAGLCFKKNKESIPRILERFECYREQSLASPLSILTVIYDDFGSKAEEWRKVLDDEVSRMEQTTEMTSLALTDQGLTDVEYERLIRDMHACNTNLIFLGDLINYEVELGQFCVNIYDVFDDLRNRENKPEIHHPQIGNHSLQWSKFLLKQSRFRQNQTQALRSRIQSQINLLYSLISQRDSRVNFIIAEDSRRITQAAQRDSRSMRTIAIMTMVFLPSTLAASIFSTGIFDLTEKGDGSRHIIAPLWWIFALVSLLFTSLVILAWWFWNRRAAIGNGNSNTKIELGQEPHLV